MSPGRFIDIKWNSQTFDKYSTNTIIVFVSTEEKGGERTMRQTLNVKSPLWKQRNMFGARIKIMWEEQLVDPSIHYIKKI